MTVSGFPVIRKVRLRSLLLLISILAPVEVSMLVSFLLASFPNPSRPFLSSAGMWNTWPWDTQG